MVPGATVILLTTTGRRSGKPRTVPVASWAEGDDLIVGGFAGTELKDPAWVGNVRGSSRVSVQVKNQIFEAIAVEMSPDERDAVIARHNAEHPLVGIYVSRAKRPIPMFRLRKVLE